MFMNIKLNRALFRNASYLKKDFARVGSVGCFVIAFMAADQLNKEQSKYLIAYCPSLCAFKFDLFFFFLSMEI